MRLLLDTHIVLWAVNDDARLSANISAAAIEDFGNTVYFSHASLWEAGIKLAQGRLSLPGGSLNSVLDGLRARNVELLPITLEHISTAATLPFHHGDPFDRMIAAQAIIEDLHLVTDDPKLSLYDVQFFPR